MNRTSLLFFYTLTLMILLPQMPLLYFAPFLVISFYKQTFTTCLWLSLLCGLIVDLFAAQTRLGLYGINYCITTFFLYSQRTHFFEDSLSTVPILTLFFSISSTLIQTALLYAMGQDLLLSWMWVRSDLFLMPLVDAVYAAIAFTLPSLFIPRIKPKRTRHFSLKEDPYDS